MDWTKTAEVNPCGLSSPDDLNTRTASLVLPLEIESLTSLQRTQGELIIKSCSALPTCTDSYYTLVSFGVLTSSYQPAPPPSGYPTAANARGSETTFTSETWERYRAPQDVKCIGSNNRRSNVPGREGAQDAVIFHTWNYSTRPAIFFLQKPVRKIEPSAYQVGGKQNLNLNLRV